MQRHTDEIWRTHARRAADVFFPLCVVTQLFNNSAKLLTTRSLQGAGNIRPRLTFSLRALLSGYPVSLNEEEKY